MSPYCAALVLVNPSTSCPLAKLPVMLTDPCFAVVASPSVNVTPLSTATGVDATLSPSTKAVLPPEAVKAGGEERSTYVKLLSVGVRNAESVSRNLRLVMPAKAALPDTLT